MDEQKRFSGPWWRDRDAAFFGKIRTNEGIRARTVPVDVASKPEHKDRAARWLEENHARLIAEAEGTTPKPKPVQTIRDLNDTWLKYRGKNPKVSAATYVQNESNMRLHVLTHAIANMPLPDVSAGQCRDWVRGLVEAGMAPYSVRNVVNSLTAFFADMLAEDAIDLPANPMKHEKVRRVIPEAVVTAGEGVVVHVLRAEATKFLSCDSPAIPSWRRTRDLLAMTSGLREGELAGLLWSHINLEHRGDKIPYVNVQRQLRRRKFKDPKKKSFRFVPLHELTRTALEWWKRVGWPLWVGRRPTDDDPVFPNAEGHSWEPAHPAKDFRTDLAIAGCSTTYDTGRTDDVTGARIVVDIDYHATRRSFATYLENAGVPRYLTSELLGHAADGTAKRHYIAAAMKPRAEAIAKLDLSDVDLRWVTGGNHPAPVPTFTKGRKSVRPVRFERTTFGFEGRRSIQLSYGRAITSSPIYRRSSRPSTGAPNA